MKVSIELTPQTHKSRTDNPRCRSFARPIWIRAYRDGVSSRALRLYEPLTPDATPRLSVLRDVKERARDVEGCIKQWFSFVKPNFEKVCLPLRPRH